jgi:hypothetical protein
LAGSASLSLLELHFMDTKLSSRSQNLWWQSVLCCELFWSTATSQMPELNSCTDTSSWPRYKHCMHTSLKEIPFLSESAKRFQKGCVRLFDSRLTRSQLLYSDYIRTHSAWISDNTTLKISLHRNPIHLECTFIPTCSYVLAFDEWRQISSRERTDKGFTDIQCVFRWGGNYESGGIWALGRRIGRIIHGW